jgi:archaetidylinositol phosphate synthase
MLSFLKPKTEKALQPLARIFRHTNPNTITLFGLLFPTLFFICIMQGWYWWGLLVFVFNAVDMLDGLVARAQNKVTAFGGFLDSTIDRFADFTVIVAFGFAGIVAWEILLPLVMFTYLISYIRSRVELAAKGQLTANVGIVERTERLVLIFVGLLAYALFPSVIIAGQNLMALVCIALLILSIITVGQRVHFAYKKLD